MLKAPCKDCQDRHDNCHAECEKYIIYAEERKRIREKRNKEMFMGELIKDQVTRRIKQERRKNRR